jgi:hypothetical protein
MHQLDMYRREFAGDTATTNSYKIVGKRNNTDGGTRIAGLGSSTRLSRGIGYNTSVRCLDESSQRTVGGDGERCALTIFT